MHEVANLPPEQYQGVLNRIKVLSRLRIDDHFSAQDGAIRFVQDGQDADIRVSVMPTLEGEKIVMRLLTSAMRGFALADLGMNDEHLQLLQAAVHKPFGMILTTGPTGSGKSTTMYAVLKTMDQSALNVTTIEDPVEYRLAGVNQIQVNSQTGLTFALGLRAIVRQNPDVILVGEIRDKETAEIAVNSALTGHLLLSTFHANDASTAVPRLLEIGIEAFLLSSTLELVMAQRLVRRICESCRFAVKYTPEMVSKVAPAALPYFKKGTFQLYQGKGCPVCNGLGYRGRVGIFELIPITHKMRDLILTEPSSQAVWTLAQEEGVKSLFDDGIEKVKAGLTTLEELARVANPNS
jgi:type II secretory ATPase GspE/PulE/Tfp pilus assembly ATPase PilB-like protein